MWHTKDQTILLQTLEQESLFSSFILQIFVEHLLCAKHDSTSLRSTNVQNGQGSLFSQGQPSRQ